MESLSTTWLTDHLIDFEYKKFTLLAYLQNVQKKFNEHKLYPQLSDLVLHYDNLVKLKQNKEFLFENFPKTATGIDSKQLRITYQKLVKDDELMDQLSEIIQYALPQLDHSINEGKDLYNYVEEHLSFHEVGLLPIYQNEGYVLLTNQLDSNLLVYRYKLSLIEQQHEQYRAIHTDFVSNEVKSLSNTVNKIKMKLTKTFTELPNPATFLITSKLHFPVKETLLPIAQRLLLRRVSVTK